MKKDTSVQAIVFDTEASVLANFPLKRVLHQWWFDLHHQFKQKF